MKGAEITSLYEVLDSYSDVQSLVLVGNEDLSVSCMIPKTFLDPENLKKATFNCCLG